jgi:hypothetical protein
MTTSLPAVTDLNRHGPAPTLTAALFDLGHHCTGTCTEAADELGAQLWFLRRRFARAGRGPASLIVVDTSDYGGSRQRARQLMHTINDCLRPDGIRMVERRSDDCGVALTLVRPLPAEHRPSATPMRIVRIPS